MNRLDEIDLPLVACSMPGHERPELGYAVCGHVAEGERPVFEVVMPGPKGLGVIACAECAAARSLDVNTTMIVCPRCAAIGGWLTKELN